MKRQAPGDLIKVGLHVREIRTRRGLSLAELGSRTGLSKGLLSKIENFRAIPSLPVLVAIARGLHVDVAELVGGIGAQDDAPYLLIRAGEGSPVDREDARGFAYEALFSRPAGSMLFEGFVLTVAPRARRKRVTTHGEQFVFMLEGKVDFDLGNETVKLRAGDALVFDGRTPHVPRNPYDKPARLLALYLLDNEEA